MRSLLNLTAFVALSLFAVSCRSADDKRLSVDRHPSLYDEPVHIASPAQTDAPDPDAPQQDKAVEDALAGYVRIATQNNAGLRAAHERWVAAMEEIPQARALPDPQFTWMHFVEEVQTRTGPQQARLTLSQMFPWFGKLRLQGDAAAEHAESVWWEVEAKRLQVVRDVKDVYYEYGYLGEAIRIVRENLTLLKTLEPIVQRGIQVGGNQGDLIRLQVEIGKLESDLVSLEEFRVPINARLRSVLNSDGTDLLPWPVLLDDDVETYSLNALRDRLNRLNPKLKSLVGQIAKSETLTRRARRDGYPDFMLGLTYMPTGESTMSPGPSDSGTDPWGFTVGFTLPIWRQKYRAAEREALARENAAERDLQQTRFDLLSQLEYRAYELDDAARQVDLYRETLIPRGQQALEVTEISYESGNASFLDVIDSQRALLAFERAYWRFVATRKQRIADLEMFCGGSLP